TYWPRNWEKTGRAGCCNLCARASTCCLRTWLLCSNTSTGSDMLMALRRPWPPLIGPPWSLPIQTSTYLSLELGSCVCRTTLHTREGRPRKTSPGRVAILSDHKIGQG